MIKELGKKLTSLNEKEILELRDYIIEEHGLVMGHLESLVLANTKKLSWSKEFSSRIIIKSYGATND